MPDSVQSSETLALSLARECLYRFLSGALSSPYTKNFEIVLDPANQAVAKAGSDMLREAASEMASPLGFGELPPSRLDLQPMLERLRRPLNEIRAEYDRVFGLLVPRECPPYETEYQSAAEPFSRSQHLADIAGFYRAFGLDTSTAVPERPDHVALELEFMAFLLMKSRMARAELDPSSEAAVERVRICEETQQTFLREHLTCWVPSFATGLRRKSGGGFYAAVGELLAALVPLERRRFEIPAPRIPLSPAFIERPDEQADCNECPATLGQAGIA
jgi:TorA maturation chaperone TorD